MYQANARYAFHTKLKADEPVGAFESGTSTYTLSETPEGHTRLRLCESVVFRDDIDPITRSMEEAMMGVSVMRHIMRLKVPCEEGVEAAYADDLVFEDISIVSETA